MLLQKESSVTNTPNYKGIASSTGIFRSILAYFPYFEKIKGAFEITVLSVYLCNPPT
jgi:hypothetical protein